MKANAKAKGLPWKIVIVLALTGWFLLTLAAKAEPLDHIVATVNDSVITQSQLEDAMMAIRRSLSTSGTPQPAPGTFRKQVLAQLIDTQLQLQAAKEAGVTVSETEVDEAVSKIAQQNHMATESLYGIVERQGLDRQGYRKELRDQLIIQKAEQQAVAPTVTLTPEEIKADLATRKTIWFRKFNVALKQWIDMLHSRATINTIGADGTAA